MKGVLARRERRLASFSDENWPAPMQRSDPMAWSVLVKEVAMEGTADAEFSDFMHGRWSGLVRLGFGLTGDLQLAEDLAQTAFARAYASWGRVRKADNPDAYLRRIVVNANRNRFRRLRVGEVLTGTLPDILSAGDGAEQRTDRAALVTALMQLPYGQRAAVVLRYWLDLSETETAAILGCSVGNVKSQASRALAKLRTNSALLEGGLL
jgi:RNA polymerase sigma-70 factor (sigma-E family)